MASHKENIQNKGNWETLLSQEQAHPQVRHHKFDMDKLILCPIGDEHIGSRFLDEDSLKRNIDWCLEEGAYVILMGDELETATKTSVGAGVFEQSEIVDGQLEKAVALYTPLANEGRILGNLVGNHEMRVFNHSGTNLSRILSKLLKIPYLGVGSAFLFRVGNETYTLYATHGSSGARMPHTKIANTIKMSGMIDTEIYAQGHLHQLSHHVQNFYKIDKRSRKIMEDQKHYIICGSYLKHWGSYAHVSNMEPARIGSPKIKLSGLEHQIRVSL